MLLSPEIKNTAEKEWDSHCADLFATGMLMLEMVLLGDRDGMKTVSGFLMLYGYDRVNRLGLMVRDKVRPMPVLQHV